MLKTDVQRIVAFCDKHEIDADEVFMLLGVGACDVCRRAIIDNCDLLHDWAAPIRDDLSIIRKEITENGKG